MLLECGSYWNGRILVLTQAFLESSGSEALKASIASVRKYGGATEGYRTMLDALIPASQVLEEVTKSRVRFSHFEILRVLMFSSCF